MNIIAVYRRFYVTYKREFNTLEEAKNFLKEESSRGNLFEICVYDGKGNILWNNESITRDEINKRIEEAVNDDQPHA